MDQATAPRHKPEIQFNIVSDLAVKFAGFVQHLDSISDIVINILRDKIHIVRKEKLRQVCQKSSLRNGEKVHQLHHVGTLAIVVTWFDEAKHVFNSSLGDIFRKLCRLWL